MERKPIAKDAVELVKAGIATRILEHNKDKAKALVFEAIAGRASADHPICMFHTVIHDEVGVRVRCFSRDEGRLCRSQYGKVQNFLVSLGNAARHVPVFCHLQALVNKDGPTTGMALIRNAKEVARSVRWGFHNK